MSNGAPALSVNLHLLPAPVKTTTRYELSAINKYLQRIVLTSTESAVASVNATLTDEVSASLSHCSVVI